MKTADDQKTLVTILHILWVFHGGL